MIAIVKLLNEIGKAVSNLMGDFANAVVTVIEDIADYIEDVFR
ncbi:hypothetical protein [Pseudolactococcus carnosus]|nr:hypothetical protein [Lactococcus carnosus]